MKLAKRIVFLLPVFSLWAFLGLLVTSVAIAQEYQKEIFLKLPGGVYMDNLLNGPQCIGIDFNDNFYILNDGVLTQYNDEGEEVRKLTYTNPSRLNKPYYFDGFCFDKENNIYFYLNNSSHVIVYKSDPDGQNLEEYKLYVTVIGSGKQYPIDKPYPLLANGIIYFTRPGLSLIDGWYSYPINFVDNTLIKTEINEINMFDLPLASGKRLSYKCLDKKCKEGIITIQMGDETQSTISLTSDIYINCQYVYSLDPNFEYYLITEQTSEEPSFNREIRKFNGDKVIFTTGTLPINRIERTKTRAVVDSCGTIYYYAGDDKEIQIIRWVLK